MLGQLREGLLSRILAGQGSGVSLTVYLPLLLSSSRKRPLLSPSDASGTEVEPVLSEAISSSPYSEDPGSGCHFCLLLALPLPGAQHSGPPATSLRPSSLMSSGHKLTWELKNLYGVEAAYPQGVCPLVPPTHVVHGQLGEFRTAESGAGQPRLSAWMLLGFGEASGLSSFPCLFCCKPLSFRNR